jgi:hypothetical protein
MSEIARINNNIVKGTKDLAMGVGAKAKRQKKKQYKSAKLLV